MDAENANKLEWPTDRGTVFIRSFVTPEEIDVLSFGMGTKDFPRYRPLITGKDSLIRAASDERTNVTLAVTGDGTVVGAGILEPPQVEERWSRLENGLIMEVSIIEVDRPWRGRDLAKPILHLLVDHPVRERQILYMVGYSWTWDLDGKGLTTMAYRDMLIHLFAAQGFQIFQTNEPNITLRPENVFMARIGKDVPEASRKSFKWIRFGLDAVG
jgi:acetoin utilization protein AcuA